MLEVLRNVKILCLYLVVCLDNYEQCDQMARLFFNICYHNNDILPKSTKIAKARLKFCQ